jgi:hypothetical protein
MGMFCKHLLRAASLFYAIGDQQADDSEFFHLN